MTEKVRLEKGKSESIIFVLLAAAAGRNSWSIDYETKVDKRGRYKI